MLKHILLVALTSSSLFFAPAAFAISYSNALLRVTRHFFAGVVGLVMLVGGATSILASPVTVNLNGMVTTVDPLLASFFSVGDPMTSLFTYESSTPPGPDTACQATHCNFINAITAMSFTVGGISGSWSSGFVGLVARDSEGRCCVMNFVSGTGATPTLPTLGFAVSLTDTTGTALSTQLALPTSVNVADFDSNRWFIFSSSSDGQFTSVGGTVPVPDMLWPTLIGLVAIAVYAGQTRRPSVYAC